MYDSQCYDLAVAFLEDEPGLDTEENRRRLAQEIQDTIETFILWQTRKDPASADDRP